jgi:hypothetical protein
MERLSMTFQLDTMASAETLVRMLERQQALVEQLDGLAERQRSLIESGNSDALLSLLSQRQQIMDQFVAGQDDLARLAETCRRSTRHIDDAMRGRISGLVDDISERLALIMERDENDRTRLESGRDRVGQALGDLDTARTARAAYVKASAVTNRFADRQG